MPPQETGKVRGMLLQLLPITSILPMPPCLFWGFSKLSMAPNPLTLQTRGKGFNKAAGATGLFLEGGTGHLWSSFQCPWELGSALSCSNSWKNTVGFPGFTFGHQTSLCQLRTVPKIPLGIPSSLWCHWAVWVVSPVKLSMEQTPGTLIFCLFSLKGGRDVFGRCS